MYGKYTYIYYKDQPNLGKYAIHGSYGIYNQSTVYIYIFMFFLIPYPSSDAQHTKKHEQTCCPPPCPTPACGGDTKARSTNG